MYMARPVSWPTLSFFWWTAGWIFASIGLPFFLPMPPVAMVAVVDAGRSQKPRMSASVFFALPFFFSLEGGGAGPGLTKPVTTTSGSVGADDMCRRRREKEADGQ